MASKALPCPTVLRQLLRYEPETGKLFWKHRGEEFFPQKSSRTPSHSAAIWNKKYAGKQAFNTPWTNGYLSGSVLKVNMSAHQVAWAMTYGYWAKEIDHINREKQDNRIENLREASRSQNCANRGPNSGRSVKGVYPSANGKRWIASIQINGRTKYLGTFDTEGEAAKSFDNAAILLHGDFSMTNSLRIGGI